MTRYALTLEFDGAPYMGLQRQAHGPSVQQSVEEAVFALTGETTGMHAAGRTDAGVHALGMKVVAEGVETAQEEDMLRRQGCDEIQGYLYSRPLVPRDLASWLRQGIQMSRLDAPVLS